MVGGAATERAISFGPFRLVPTQQLLLEGERPLRLGSRALNVLIALVERPGELVSKDELMARVWPSTTVEESNLKVHVAALRRTLADGQGGNRYLVTVPGRGYRFVAPIAIGERAGAAPPQSAPLTRIDNLPLMLTRLIGRAETCSRVADQLPRQGFVTLVGAGGVGKTSVALAVAESLLGAFRDGIWLVDLAPLTDPGIVPTALAAALGLELRADDPLAELVAALEDKQMLLVLDNCEHVVEAAAGVALALLKGAPRIRILATSREPLRAEGEHVYRLRPLASPPAGSRLTAAEALAFPAVQLFVERAAASAGEFQLSDADAPVVADICAMLDGVPLAIEFAAARVDAFGVRGLVSGLDDRLRLLTSGRRTALPRHQTMRATLDWSYEFLPEPERVVLQRLAVFAGAFSLEAASAVAASREVAALEIADRIANLVAKSLVAADVGGEVVLYRLLETTRAYALEKLTKSGELRRFSRRHAEYHRDLFERAEAEWGTRPTAESFAEYRRHIDEVRAALDWAFSPDGDASIGVALTVVAVPLWFQLSVMTEARGSVARALLSIEPRIETAWTKVLELADTLDDPEYKLRALWGLWAYRITNGEFRAALEVAQRYCGVAASDASATDLPIGERMVGVVLHFLGDQAGARRHIEHVLHRHMAPVPRSQEIRFQLDRRVAARVMLARILWLQGFPDQAVRAARRAVEEARALDEPMSSLCYALAGSACPIALWVGDLAGADRAVAMLLDYSARHALALWHAWGRSFEGAIAMQRGGVAAGLQLVSGALDDVRQIRSALRHMAFVMEMAQGLGRAGEVVEGLAVIDEALERSERTDERWCAAELLRIKGELVLLQGGSKAVRAAEHLFQQSIDRARRQAVLSWELRSSTSQARLQRDRGRTEEAHGLLAAVYSRFTEGFETADLLTAKRLLDELS